ncbi:MAG TPA: hypothetical protein VL442_14560 [Mucilaginibacter sp.]|jgi:hypothetical protein|nr:hypothetical protein [Mucilaginibacter sp.]
MTVTKTRVIMSDAVLLIGLIILYFITEHFTQNMKAMSLIIVILVARSVFWHINWYKATGKIY